MPADGVTLPDECRPIAAEWKSQRAERQTRRHLEQRDFDALRDAGFLLGVVPEDDGGLWRDAAVSARPICDTLRLLGSADPAVALVSAMHPSVVSFWLLNPDGAQPAWEEQRRAVFASAAAGEQWGTITSEPGSGGDISRTRSTASAVDGDPFLVGRTYELTGDKHFGSGSGIARSDGDDRPARTAMTNRGCSCSTRASGAAPGIGDVDGWRSGTAWGWPPRRATRCDSRPRRRCVSSTTGR